MTSRADRSEPARGALTVVGRHPWLATLGVLALAIAILLALWDWNWFKGPVERLVESRTGRSFVIGGDVDVDLGRVTRVRADGLRFGNAKWSKQPVMASTDRLEFGIRPWPLLLRREVLIPDIHLVRPRLRLEKGPGGVGNWVFGTPGGMQPRFGRLWVADGRLVYLDRAAKTDIDVDVDSSTTGPSTRAPPIDVHGNGRWKGSRFALRGHAESPLALRDRQQPYRIDATFTAGATRAHVRGTLVDPLRMRDFNLQLALSGQDLEDLYPLLGLAVPPSSPYAFDGRFTRTFDGGRTVWHYDGFHGKVGDSDLAGDASVTLGGPRPYLRANLASRRVDFDDLAVFIGKAPQARGGESSNARLAAQAARERASTRVLPDTPYNLTKLRAMDADVRWRASQLSSPTLPLDDMDAHLKLENAVVQMDPLNFGVAGGDIRSEIRMDAREATIHTRASINARGLNLGKLMPDVKLAKEAIGKVGGKVALTGNGNSIAGMLGSSDGDVAIGMGRGEISNLVIEMAGLDIEEALKFMIRGDRRIPIRCAFGDFGVRNGVMTSRALAFDTTDTIIVGNGSISLGDETLDLRLRPRPKDRSLLVFRSPLLVTGTFKQPQFRPDMGRVGLRAAFALALATIAPPAALLATLELGPGKDADCGGHYAK